MNAYETMGRAVAASLNARLPTRPAVAVRPTGEIIVQVPPEQTHVVRQTIKPLKMHIRRTEYWGGEDILCVIRCG